MADHFVTELADLGFVLAGRDRRGVAQYARRPNRFLTEWVHDDGQHALLTWEYELGEYCATVGWQIGASETSMQILYPQRDVRLARVGAVLADELARLEADLAGVDLTDPRL